MRITLISFYFSNPGIRFLSSYLKNHGIHTELIFMLPDNMYDSNELFTDQILNSLKSVSSMSRVIGISVMSNDFFRAKQLTNYLKINTQAIVIWGGIHPTVFPENIPHNVDYIYRGEGEHGFLEFIQSIINNTDLKLCKNISYFKNNQVFHNPLLPLMRDNELDHFQDFDFENHYIRHQNQLVPVTFEIIKNQLHTDFEINAKAFTVIFTRGCMHGCTYCCNNRINSIYSGEKNVFRSKTPQGMIDELTYITHKFPFIKFIYINDDNFLANGFQIIDEFSKLYKAKIDLPFKVLGSPAVITQEKIESLLYAGLREVHMGIQTGSERVKREIYRRNISNQKVIEVDHFLSKFNLRKRYDFIFDNPYETKDDLLQTARLILQLQKPYIMQSFSLTFYQGTQLYDWAMRDGFIHDEIKEIFEKKSNEFSIKNVTYLKLICLAISRLPTWISKILLMRVFVTIFDNKIFSLFYKYLFIILNRYKKYFSYDIRKIYTKQFNKQF